jgi:hypothetical protein
MSEQIKYHEQQAGWTHEYTPDGQCICFCRPQELGGGYVTVDFAQRIFACGHGRPHKHAGSKTYAGRGWKDQIIRDAIDHLEQVMKS